MSKYTEKKEQLKNEGGNKKVFNESHFNQLATALFNETDYITPIYVNKKGVSEKRDINPTIELRSSMMKQILKEAGVDSGDIDRLINEFKFSTLPFYQFISTALSDYLETGKSFKLLSKENVVASLSYREMPEIQKTVRTPGTGETKQKQYDAHYKLVAKSPCPQNKMKNL